MSQSSRKPGRRLSELWRASGWRGRVAASILGGFALAVIGGAGAIVTQLVQGQIEAHRRLAALEPPPDAAAEAPAPREVDPFTYTYEVKGVSVPLADRAATRITYATFSLSLDCASPGCRRAMEINRARVLNSLYETATKFYVEDFSGPEGLTPFKAAVSAGLRGAFGELAPRAIAIREWVIQ